MVGECSKPTPEEGTGAPTSFTPIDTSRGRFRVNLLANLIYFVFNAGIQLWFTPYLIHSLGVATYGLVPLATNITNYMAILTVALTGSVGRFLTIDLAREDLATANRTFNTSLFASIALAAGLLPAALALSWFAPSFLNIPEGAEMGTRFLLMCTSFAFLLNAVGSNFACSTFAKNRFDVQRMVDAAGFLTQILVVVALFIGVGPNLWYVGIGIAGSAVVRQVLYQISWRKQTPELSVSFRAFDRSRFREILGMGGWLTVDALGVAALAGTPLLLANVLVGAEGAGLLAPVTQVTTLIATVAATARTALAPTVVAMHGRGQRSKVVETTRAAMELLGLVIAIPAGILCGIGGPVLEMWLGPGFSSMGLALAIFVAPQAATAGASALYSVNTASGRVAGLAGATLGGGLLFIALSLSLGRPLLLGVVGIALAYAVSNTTKTALFLPLYASRIVGGSPGLFLTALAAPVAGEIFIAGLLWLARLIVPTARPVALVGLAIGVSAAYLPVAWLLMARPTRVQVRRLLGQRRRPSSGAE